MRKTPPGWYDDGFGAMRWWDGSQWTEHTAAPDAETDADAPTEAEILAAGATEQDRTPSPTESGTDAARGAFAAATSPKSRRRVWWFAGGIVLLGVVIGAAILIPALFMAANGGAQGPVASEEDQAEAISAVELYGLAWAQADCDSFMAATTENFRALVELTDCAAFDESALAFTSTVSDYTMTVREVVSVGMTVSVKASENYTSFFDAEGNPTTEPQQWEDRAEFYVIETDDGWAIDDWFVD